MTRPRIAVVGTGGTIASIGANPHELVNYIDRGQVYTAEELVSRTPGLTDVADPVVVPFSAVGSHAIGPAHWLELARTINNIPDSFDDIEGVVVTHGTATLEETAWFLNLTLKIDLPVIVVGAQRPHTGLSTDAHINLANGARAAASPAVRGLGVLVCLNGEIHAAREATKTSTFRMQTFKAPESGVLGHVDHDRVSVYRHPVRRRAPDTEFDTHDLDALPRVDIAYAYAGADGAAIDAFVSAGAKGIVAAGFAPGLNTDAMLESLERASHQGVIVVQGSRAGSGRVTALKTRHASGSITADNLTVQKARILLMLGLTRSNERDDIQRMFEHY